MNTVNQLKTIKANTAAMVCAELSRTGGLLRLAPAWVPRSGAAWSRRRVGTGTVRTNRRVAGTPKTPGGGPAGGP
jgi:hypothetical protein